MPSNFQEKSFSEKKEDDDYEAGVIAAGKDNEHQVDAIFGELGENAPK